MNRSSLLQLPSLCIVSIIEALMPNSSVATILQLQREWGKALKQRCGCIQFTMCGCNFPWTERRWTGKPDMSSSMRVWGRFWHILTMEPYWQKLEGHHEGAIEGEDSQELQR